MLQDKYDVFIDGFLCQANSNYFTKYLFNAERLVYVFSGLSSAFKDHLEKTLGGTAGSVASSKTLPAYRQQSLPTPGPTSPPTSGRFNMPLPPTPTPHQLHQDHEYEELPANYIKPDETTYVNEQL